MAKVVDILCVLALTCLAVTFGQVVPHSDTLSKVGDDGVLKCQVGNPNLTGVWERHGVEVKSDDARITVSSKINGTILVFELEIKEADYQNELGEYDCVFNEGAEQKFRETVHLNAVPHVNKFDSKSKNLVEGDKLKLNCDAYGFPELYITWYNDDILIEADERISFADYNNVPEDKDAIVTNGTLVIKDAVFSDAGNYSCLATNSQGNNTKSIVIRVKSKYAALWPFLGICAEVIILCVIIFIYERRRAAKLAKEDAKEEGEADKLTNANSEVRQRKT